MVPRILTPEQKETRMNICADILQNTENDPNFLGKTCDETCFFFFFSMTRKLSTNPSTGRVPGHQEKKHGRATQISKQR
jgi:hypothetical protein